MAKKKHITKIPPLLIPWVVFGILMTLTAAVALPTKTASYEVSVPYIAKENYTIEVPYETVEPYTVQVPYETKEQYTERIPVQEMQTYLDQECQVENLNYNVQWVTCKSAGWFSNGEATISVVNVDSTGGSFTFKVGYLKGGVFFGAPVTKTIDAGRTETFTYTFTESSIDSCRQEPVTIPTKQVCQTVQKEKNATVYKDVIKERTVTKYRDETRYQTVTKTRAETREREVRKERNETRQKEVNWLFGFDAPIKFRNLG